MSGSVVGAESEGEPAAETTDFADERVVGAESGGVGEDAGTTTISAESNLKEQAVVTTASGSNLNAFNCASEDDGIGLETGSTSGSKCSIWLSCAYFATHAAAEGATADADCCCAVGVSGT